MMWLTAYAVGCAPLRVPAIDPSGRRIFLPPPAYTTIGSPQGVGGNAIFQQPPSLPPAGEYGQPVPYNDSNTFFQTGPWGLSSSVPPTLAVPGSPPPGVAVPNATASSVPYLYGSSGITDGHLAKLVVTPRRLVAPVGREVVLLAGLCGQDGYLLRDQLIEWSLSNDSVGSIVEVDLYDKPLWRHLMRKPPRKLSGQYAQGLTSAISTCLPRGTPDPSDDIQVLEGQTWISLTSNTEGATQVTVVAPTASGWEDRREYATVHWVDGQWELPPPAFGGAAGATFTTRVTRATSNLPVEGWRVRYVIAGGTPAAFDTNGAQSIEVATNSDGLASVTMLPLGEPRGSTDVRIQIIRVGTSPADLPKLVVGEGSTAVTWVADGRQPPPASGPPSSPDAVLPPVVPPTSTPARITVTIDGPTIAEVDATATYQITVTNVGNEVVEGVEVVSESPRELQYQRSTPGGGEFGDSVRWQLSAIQPGDSRAISVDYRVTAAGTIRNCVRATAGTTSVEDCTTTEVRSSNLNLEIRGPVSAAVGELLSYQILVANGSDLPVSSLRLEATYDAGLVHARGRDGVSWDVGAIGPRQTQSYPIRLQAVEAGRPCLRVRGIAGDGGIATGEFCTEIGGTAARPGLELRIETPDRTRVGSMDAYSFVLTNVGSAPLTNVGIRVAFDAALSPRDYQAAVAPSAAGLQWEFPTLAPGGSQRVSIRAQAVSPSGRACVQAVAIAAEGVRDSREACLQIETDGQVVPPPTLPPDSPSPFSSDPSPFNSSDLAIQVTRPLALSDALGERTYLIQVANRGNANQSDVTVGLQLPEGTEFLSARTPPGAEPLNQAGDRSRIEFRPIRTLRAGESVAYEVKLRQLGATVGTLRAEVRSLESQQPVSASG